MSQTAKEIRVAWDKENMAAFTLKFAKKSDADVIEKLKTVQNRTDYIRQLIREDMSRE